MITYSSGPLPIPVCLDKRHVGNIVRHEEGFRYEPKGSNLHGETMKTIGEVKRSLEDD